MVYLVLYLKTPIMRVISILLVCLTFSVYGQQTLTKTLTHNWKERTYILYIPSSYNSANPTPLVFNFHGLGSNATEQMGYGDFRLIADTAGFIIVHPQGLKNSDNLNYFNAGFDNDVDDIGFTHSIINSLLSEYNIDRERIYSTGMSNGGYMSYYLSRHSDHFAAVASVTGAMIINWNGTPKYPTPILSIHGTNDLIVPYDGNYHSLSVDDAINYWVDYNNCNTTPIRTDLPNTNTGDGSTVTKYVFTECDSNASVELYKITGAGHTWPGSYTGLSQTNYDIDGAEVIWEFFRKHKRNSTSNAIMDLNEIEQNSIEIFPNPSYDRIIFKKNSDEKMDLNIYDQNGSLIYSRKNINNELSVSTKDWSKGVYSASFSGSDNRVVSKRVVVVL